MTGVPILHRLRRAALAQLVVVALAACGPPPLPTTPVAATPADATPVRTAAAAVSTALPAAEPGAPRASTAPSPPSEPPATQTSRPAATPTASPAGTPRPTEDTRPLRLDAAAGAPPGAVRALLVALAAAGASVEQAGAGAAGEPDLRVVSPTEEGAIPAWELVLAPAVRASSVVDSIRFAELTAAWSGAGKPVQFAGIYVTSETAALLTPLLGRPGAGVKVVAEEEIEAAVWRDANALAIVPFDKLSIRLRAVKVDGQSPTDNQFEGAKWPLTARAGLLGLTERGRAHVEAVKARLKVTNRRADRLTVLVMTGVTAMARHSAGAIERSGDYGFLARVVGPELAAADITIISNEIPFARGCVPDERANALVLCSRYEYWENLALSGVDAVGLSGNHLNDFGRKELLGTLAFYKEKQIPYYGGGSNAKEALAPLVLEHNGNRLGFLAANQHGPVVAWAGQETPGSARFELKSMQAAIQALKPKVDLVFAEVQHLETNYQGEYVNVPNSGQEFDFKGLNDAGADVVTGVMAHAPQAVEVRNGRLILYGLGNLYFDQTWSWPTRTGLVARHTIYDGRLINTELLVTVIEMNWQLRWATAEERDQVLKSIFAVSRW